MQTSESITHIAAALISAQADIPLIHKNGTNKFHNYKFADLESYMDTLKPILKIHGLAVVASPHTSREAEDGRILVAIKVRLIHTSGEWIEADALGEGQDLSSKGKIGDKATYKAITGARKYALASLFNLATSDDPEKDETTEDNREPRSASRVTPAPADLPAQTEETVDNVVFVSGVAKQHPSGFKFWVLKSDVGTEFKTRDEKIAEFVKQAKADKKPCIVQHVGFVITHVGYSVADADLPF